MDYSQYVKGEWQRVSGNLPDEMMLTVFVNGQELVTILCTPEKLNCLVLGFLRSEGFITSPDDVTLMRVCEEDSLAEVRLKDPIIVPQKRVLTSGCGAGTTFASEANLKPLTSNWSISPEQVLTSIKSLQQSPTGQNTNVRRGVHVSALSDGSRLLVTAEDIGRHNTLDKIWGECMLKKIPTEDRLLVTTGRISSEMLVKAARMGVPVVASFNSATRRAVEIGDRLGITAIGYVRGNRFSVYSGEWRLRGKS